MNFYVEIGFVYIENRKGIRINFIKKSINDRLGNELSYKNFIIDEWYEWKIW